MRSLLLAVLLIAAPLSLPMASAGPTVDVLGGGLYVEVDRNVGQPNWGTKNVYASTNAVPFDVTVAYAPYCSWDGCWDRALIFTGTPVGPAWAQAGGQCPGIGSCGFQGWAVPGGQVGLPSSNFGILFCGTATASHYQLACGVLIMMYPAGYGAIILVDHSNQACILMVAGGEPDIRCVFPALQGDPSMMVCESSYWFTPDGDCAGLAVTTTPASCAYVLLGRGGADRYPVVCVRP